METKLIHTLPLLVAGERTGIENGGPIRVAVLGDLPVFSEGLGSILERSPDVKLVGVAAEIARYRRLTRRGRAQVGIVETSGSYSDAIETTRRVSQGRPRVLVMSLSEPADLGVRILRAGAQGYLAASAGPEEIFAAVRALSRGHVYVSARLKEVLAERYLGGRAKLPGESISNRELQVLCRLASGATNREIADELCISVKTVDTHRANILRKLELRNNADVTRFAIRSGFVRC